MPNFNQDITDEFVDRLLEVENEGYSKEFKGVPVVFDTEPVIPKPSEDMTFDEIKSLHENFLKKVRTKEEDEIHHRGNARGYNRLNFRSGDNGMIFTRDNLARISVQEGMLYSSGDGTV